MSINDYNIISILGSNISSTTYKVEHKETGKLYVWKIIDYENISDSDKQYLIDKVNKRKGIHHPNLLEFYNYIDQDDNKTLYIVSEYCENNSLRNVIDSCSANNTYLSEEFVCKLLYQIAFTLKTINSYTGELSTKEIFLDENLNVKLYNFTHNYKYKIYSETKICHLGSILYEICTFKTFNKNSYETELKQIGDKYSHILLSLIIYLLKDKSDLRKNINNILCHPTILLKSAQWIKEKSFINFEKPEKLILPQMENNNEDEHKTYSIKLEKLRNKETLLHVREQQLYEWEYQLKKKERKIILMEKVVKEKLQQAELYLKRCKESKSVSSESTKSTATTNLQEKKSYENLDSTYVSSGDSVLLPTSSKLNVSKIVKPAPFTRTLSERRIRFKGHSPLKEIDFNKKRNMKQSKSHKGILLKKNCEWLTCSEENDISSTDGSSDRVYKKGKQLFSAGNTHENDFSINVDDKRCSSITWTEESKKYAFELLRMMNSDKENQPFEIKHTYL